MRLLACGGRDYRNRAEVQLVCDSLHVMQPIKLLIHGMARGADTLAAEWALENGIPVLGYTAEWDTLGRTAGLVRNRRMLDEGKPDAVVAFPGGRGTAHMVEISRAAGLPVCVVNEHGGLEFYSNDT